MLQPDLLAREETWARLLLVPFYTLKHRHHHTNVPLPTRSDGYDMLISCEVRQVLCNIHEFNKQLLKENIPLPYCLHRVHNLNAIYSPLFLFVHTPIFYLGCLFTATHFHQHPKSPTFVPSNTSLPWLPFIFASIIFLTSCILALIGLFNYPKTRFSSK